MAETSYVFLSEKKKKKKNQPLLLQTSETMLFKMQTPKFMNQTERFDPQVMAGSAVKHGLIKIFKSICCYGYSALNLFSQSTVEFLEADI